MMKRVASAIFLLIFTASTVGRIVQRTEAWAAEHTYNSKHSVPNQATESTAEAHKQTPREKQTKLLEDGSVLHVSFVASPNTPSSADAFARMLTGFVTDATYGPRSSRAPPTSFLF
jgi:acetyl-CoA carboxylase carboxyltransferase component